MTRPTPYLGKHGGLLDAEPIRRCIESDLQAIRADRDDGNVHASGLNILARHAGVCERRLYDIRHGRSKSISLDNADRYCCSTGRHLAALYPSLYLDEQIAADVAATEARAGVAA